MHETFELKGEWFLPGDENNKIDGTLYYNPDGNSSLELIGTFGGNLPDLLKKDIILGFSTTGKKVTLIHCFESRRTNSFPGIPTSAFSVHYIFIGAYFYKIEDLRFDKAIIKLTKFEEWVNVWGYEMKFKGNRNALELNYEIPKNIKFNINDHLSGSFTFSYSPPSIHSKTIKITQNTNLELESNQKVDYFEFIKLILHFKLFVTLGIFEDLYFESIIFQSSELKENIDKEKQAPLSIKFYYTQRELNPKIKNRHFHDFLFTYKQIETRFEELITKWYALRENILPVLDILFETFSKKSVLVENRFLNVVQALEIYHRRVKEDKEKLKSTFQNELNSILEKVNNDQKKWLKEKLEYSYEPTLSVRLKEIFKEFKISPLSKIVNNKRDIDSIIFHTVSSRNYYTHYNPALKNKAYRSGKLFYLTEKLKVLLILVIMKETGFKNEEIESLFERNAWRYFNHILKK